MIVVFVSVNLMYAQDVDSYIEILKSELKTNKKAIITKTMEFTDQQSSVFWPIYGEYEKEMEDLTNERIANIKDFASNYDNMNDEKATQLINNSYDFQSDRIALNEEYFTKFSEALSPTVAAKFMQLQQQIQLVVDLSIASNLPLVKKSETKTDSQTEVK
jgi:hypothetical protein